MTPSLAVVGEPLPGDPREQIWNDALLAAMLCAVDPAGLGGVALRCGPSPASTAWLAALRANLPETAVLRRIPAMIDDDRLLGGLDLGATMNSGRAVLQNGVLADADRGMIVIAMAERMPVSTAARIAAVMETGILRVEREGFTRLQTCAFGVVALDEGIEDGETVPAILSERLAFRVDLGGVRPGPWRPETSRVAAARARLSLVDPPADDLVAALAATASAFGISSLTAVVLAMRAMRASAALAGRTAPGQEDATIAARLVLAPRALCLPAEQCEEPSQSDPQPKDDDVSRENTQSEGDQLEEILRDAVRTVLPPELLRSLEAGGVRRSPSPRDGSGAVKMSRLRGRPVGVRAGKPGGGARLALVETLRAAAPWQPLRLAGRKRERILVRVEDLRIRRFAQRREATVVFCVDASGSTAFHRLAEAKGAVEALLADAYVARTYVGLIAFRGQSAEILLPPSRSLTRARNLLAALPGGGGTPLAAGFDAALALALGEKAKGRDPLIVVLTDGRANVARDGSRSTAMADARSAACAIAASHISSVFIDTSPLPREEGKSLAAAMLARFVALPRADAEHLVRAVRG
jgi:magnesium chelatase subunit D